VLRFLLLLFKNNTISKICFANINLFKNKDIILRMAILKENPKNASIEIVIKI